MLILKPEHAQQQNIKAIFFAMRVKGPEPSLPGFLSGSESLAASI
jgi:hypothetical protein